MLLVAPFGPGMVILLEPTSLLLLLTGLLILVVLLGPDKAPEDP